MNEQLGFPFKKEIEKEKIVKIPRGKMPTPEEDEELTMREGGKLTSEEKNQEAGEKASKEFWSRVEEFEERGKEEKED
jgi:hypothetical protein